MRYSNEFYFVTPAALVNAAEVPAECGLVEAGHATFEEWKQLIRRHGGFFNYDDRSTCDVIVADPSQSQA